MATPAAILGILVKADTSSATASLSKFNSGLGTTHTSATKATTTTSKLGAATKTAGSSLATAARYAAGAAAAYISISQAKAAIETTQELANTTASLRRNLGFATKQASRWASVAATRDLDTKQMNASFATLAKNVSAGGDATDAAKDAFKSLGITQKDLAKTGGDFNKQVLLVADAFGEAEGGAARQAAAQTLLGRGYQNLLPLMAKGGDALQEQLELGDKYGATMGRDAVKAQTDLTASLRESERAWQGMQVTFTTAVTPAVEKLNDQFQRVSQILADPKLTDDEKWTRIAGIIERDFSRAMDVIVAMIPTLAENVGEQAPRIAGALVEGFLNADTLGKLALSAWFIRALGGWQIIRGLGTKIGGRLAAGVAIGLVTLGLTDPWVRKQLDKFGNDLGEFVVNGMIDAVNLGIEAINKTMDEANLLAFAGVDAPEIGPIGHVDFESDVERQQEARRQSQERHQKEMRRSLERFQTDLVQATHVGQTQLEREWQPYFRNLDKTSSQTADTRDKTANASSTMADKVGGNFMRMSSTAGRGLGILRDNTNKALSALSAGEKVNFSLKTAGKAATGFQSGGVIVPGTGSGDKVPAMLEPGEVVWNKKAVANIFGSAMNANMANSLFKRFASGGIVTLGQQLQRQGYLVGEHPAFGGVSAVHAPGSFHYCVPMDTEILTREGWKSHDQVRVGDETLGYNPETRRSEWTPITEKVHFSDVGVKCASHSRFSARFTDGHRWLVDKQPSLYRYQHHREPQELVCPECGEMGTKRGAFVSLRALSIHRARAHGAIVETEPAPRTRVATVERDESAQLLPYEDIADGQRIRLAAEASTTHDLDITVEEVEVIAWALTDGWIHRETRADGSVASDIRIYQKKARYVEALDELLAEFPHSRRIHNSAGVVGWYIHRAVSMEILRRARLDELGPEGFVLALGTEERRAFLRVCQWAEGSAKGGYRFIAQNEGPVKDAIALAAYLTGYSVVSGERGVKLRRPHVQRGKLRTQALGREDVWCVVTELGSWTMRQDEQVMLTGNSGQALDVNWVPVSQEMGKLDSLYGRLKNMPGVIELLWRVADHFDHLHVAMAKGASGGFLGGMGNIARVLLEGPKGPLRNLGQGALDKVRKGANSYLSGLSFETSEAGAGGLGKPALAQLWNATGRGGDANLMAAIALAESGGVPGVTNSIGARGLWQIIPSTARAFGYNYERLTDPRYNAQAAHSILAGQGLGAWEAYTNGAYRQYLQEGGVAEHLHHARRRLRRFDRHPYRQGRLEDLQTRLEGIHGHGMRARLFRAETRSRMHDIHQAQRIRHQGIEANIGRYGTLLDLLRERRGVGVQSAAVAAAQAGALGMPVMHRGGIVPGPVGSPQPVLAEGGELMGGRGGIKVIVHGDIYSDRRDPVEVVIGDRRFRAAVQNVRARGGNRPLPGRAGGI